jgi:crotonobetainyl-CoA:carnitine CoA-transferase CaiB-like acyl-CoA transferase
MGHESPIASPHGVYPTLGVERYITIACETAAQWRALCSVAALDAFSDETFDRLEARLAADAEIDAALAAWCSEQEPFDLSERLKRAGVPASVVLRPSDLFEDAQLSHRGFFVTAEHAEMGLVPYDGPVTEFSRTPPVIAAAPCLGQHTYEVLTGILGYSEAQIAAFAERGALT